MIAPIDPFDDYPRVKPLTGWTPNQSHIVWVQQLIQTIQDGGMWIVPGNMSIVQIFLGNKTFLLREGSPDDENNRRTATILDIIGWRFLVPITQKES